MSHILTCSDVQTFERCSSRVNFGKHDLCRHWHHLDTTQRAETDLTESVGTETEDSAFTSCSEE